MEDFEYTINTGESYYEFDPFPIEPAECGPLTYDYSSPLKNTVIKKIDSSRRRIVFKYTAMEYIKEGQIETSYLVSITGRAHNINYNTDFSVTLKNPCV